ncbi:MAG: 3'-5' exonuclease [Clostridiales bacterium]|nr:3'-5' exonuclease [Clostridiales bacterium]
MKLVFFDIECAGVHKTYAKICVFGYVVCDEKFNILEKEDILINPKGRFELTDRKGEKGLVLPYSYEDFKRQPPFPQVYKRIKALLEDKDSYILGHAVLNDVKYLNLETRRFRLPSFNFSFSDSQLLFMTHIDDFSRQFGLEHIANTLGVEFTPHRAVDDAYATMKIIEAMCAARNCTFPELIAKLNVAPGKIVNYQISRPQSKGFKRFNAQKKAAKVERSQKRIKFFNNLSKKRVNRSGGVLKGKTITFSRAIEDDIEISIPLVDKIYAAGGRYSQKLDSCTLYVSAEDDTTTRTQAAAGRALPHMTVDELLELINA